MAGKTLVDSALDRQNILNNQLAVSEIEKAIGIKGVLFEGMYRFTKKQIAQFYEIDERTIDRYLENHKDELHQNGYEVLRSKRLKNFKLAMEKVFANDIDVVNIKIDEKAPVLGVFDFRSFLNIGMLLTESDVAKELRAKNEKQIGQTLSAQLQSEFYKGFKELNPYQLMMNY